MLIAYYGEQEGIYHMRDCYRAQQHVKKVHDVMDPSVAACCLEQMANKLSVVIQVQAREKTRATNIISS